MRKTARNRMAAGVLLSALLAGAGSCQRPAPPPTEVVALRVNALPATPDDRSWNQVSAYTASLIPQDMVEPRLLELSTRTVRVQAMTDGQSIAFRLCWDDAGGDDLPGPSRFSDACAVQLPIQPGPDLPAPQMGEAGKRVEITYWNAAWQAEVDGRSTDIESIYPRSGADHYPFEAPSLEVGSEEQRAMAERYAPAKAAHRPSHADGQPVQDLIAEGPGTITASPTTLSRGHGKRDASGWSVVIVRPLPAPLRGETRTQVAFAIWEGSRQEAGARKMRSIWIPLALGVTS